MKVAVVGAGYVGLVTAACLSDFGLDVVCIDKDAGRIERLRNGEVPIYEPGLNTLIAKNAAAGRLAFSTQLKPQVAGADVVLIAVGTPSRRGEDAADLAYVHEAAADIAGALSGYTVVVTKSTVPVGTARTLATIIRSRRPKADFDMAANPEFLREGCAVSDFMHPDRIVIGSESERARERLRQLYLPLARRDVPIVFTGLEAAELIKYAANAYLAARVAFVNELADLCEAVGADVQMVVRGVGLDHRVGLHYLQPGPGFGGACFPKDTRALAAAARLAGVPMATVDSVIAANDVRKASLAARVSKALGGDLRGLRIAVLGLSFKADTDDLREAPAIRLIPDLQRLGARIAAYDPAAMAAAKAVLAGVDFGGDAYEAATGADCLVVLTEWNEFRGLDLDRLARLMRRPVMIDFRNLYSLGEVAKTPFTYHSTGRPAVIAAAPAVVS